MCGIVRYLKERGFFELQLKKVQWTGPLVNQKTLYQSIVILWSVVVLAVLAYRLIVAQREIKRQVAIQD